MTTAPRRSPPPVDATAPAAGAPPTRGGVGAVPGGVARRPLLAAGLAAIAAATAGCVSRSPPSRFYRLPVAVPPGVAAAAPLPAPAAADGWLLMTPVRLPAYLDRDELLVPAGSGAAAVELLATQRWAEPLRDAVPRLLHADLAVLRSPAPVWTPPLPPGAAAPRQLRVEVLALDALPGRDRVRIAARWTLADRDGERPPREHALALDVPTAGSDIDAIVVAHRVAVRRLAEAIAATR